LPRRLGDDPLSRAKAAKASLVAVHASGASGNDVFFQRRVESEQAPVQTTEAPEITEISQIPEIKEIVATAPQAAPAAPTTEPPQASTVRESVDKLDAAPAPQEPVAPAPFAEPTLPPAASQPGTAVEPEQSGGFLKRLLGKLT
jgi:hypothetical protein